MAAVIEASERISQVHIEGLALMKIVKHCHESLPHMVSGSLLGMEASGGILEVTHAFPFPDSRAAAGSAAAVSDTADGDQDGHEYQIEMMRMLREVNVDNSCVGWYQSMYLGIYSTSSLLENQLSYQTDLSPNAVVILYDPMQTTHGKLSLKCYRLTDECIRLKENEENAFIDPRKIFEEVPIKLTNPGLVKALLMDVADGVHDDTSNLQLFEKEHNTKRLGSSAVKTTFDGLDLSTNPYLEKHLEFLCGWVDDLAVEQQKMQYYARQLHRDKHRRKDSAAVTSSGDAWASSDAPRRMESLLITNQIRSYCEQMNKFTSEGIEKVYLMSGMHKKE